MSARVPDGFVEMWMSFNLSTDPEPMFVSLGGQLVVPFPGANQTDTDAMLTAMQTHLKAMVASNYSVGPGHVIWGGTSGDIRIDGSIAAAAGTNGTTPLPQNCAYLIRKGTGVGGRRNQGRMYVPGCDPADVANNGALTLAARTALQTNADALLNALIALTVLDDVRLFHNSAPFTPTEILSLTVQTFIATQRRRLRHS